jgi:choline dehydrogenase
VTQFDYVIVGAGPAGCVLANRLSADPGVEVLLVEAGDEDTNPLIAVPMGYAQLLDDPTTAWHYPIRSFGPSKQVEHWVRGKTLGGSSSVNGMVYNRGHRADYDALESLGNPGWGWDDMLPAFKTIEDNELGASDLRGAGGPLQVSTVDEPDPLLDDVITRAPSSAGARCGTSTRATRSASVARWRRSVTVAGATQPTRSCTRSGTVPT